MASGRWNSCRPIPGRAAELTALLSANELQLALFNTPTGGADAASIDVAWAWASCWGTACLPGRHEPDVGEINYPYRFAVLDELGYSGWGGFEYQPIRAAVAGATSAGLNWLKSRG